MDNLKGLDYRKRQNIERKAARAAMQRYRKAEKAAWLNYPVKMSSAEWGQTKTKTYKSGRTKKVASYSMRKSAAKSVTVKVSTKRGKPGTVGYSTRATVFLNYQKKGAGPAKFAHFGELGTKHQAAKMQMLKLYRRRDDWLYRDFVRALSLWIFKPKATAKQVGLALDV